MIIVVFPLRTNPYQNYLYDNLKKIASTTVFYFINDINTTTRMDFIKFVLGWPYRLSRIHDKEKIFHLHWQFFYFLFRSHVLTIPTIILCIWILAWVKLLGFKLIWTVHDYSQHDTNKDLDKLIRKIVVFLSDRIIVLNRTSKKELLDNDKVDESKIKIIPIGNYGADSSYRAKETNQEFSFSFFGLLSKYKGVERLISSFKRIEGNYLQLNIIGYCHDIKYFNHLKKMSQQDKRIKIENKFLPINELELLIYKSDIVVLPFLEVTNSSSAIMAFSKGRPVIAPYIGSFKDQPSDLGYLYTDNTEEQLLEKMKLSIKNKSDLPQMGMNALNFARTLKWSNIANDTYLFYKETLL